MTTVRQLFDACLAIKQPLGIAASLGRLECISDALISKGYDLLRVCTATTDVQAAITELEARRKTAVVFDTTEMVGVDELKRQELYWGVVRALSILNERGIQAIVYGPMNVAVANRCAHI